MKPTYLYLLKSYGLNKTILRLGLSIDPQARLRENHVFNPGSKIVSSKPGSRAHLRLLHFYLRASGFLLGKGGDCWYQGKPEVLEAFDWDQTTLGDKIWESRDILPWTPKDYPVFKYLCLSHQGDLKTWKTYQSTPPRT